jgi:hypothetical protein
LGVPSSMVDLRELQFCVPPLPWWFIADKRTTSFTREGISD